jgi:hypothetical protein
MVTGKVPDKHILLIFQGLQKTDFQKATNNTLL